jgi:hypothetical protein
MPEMEVVGEVAPLFVVGCGRSGSTMLRLMLDSHPEIAIPGESHFIPALWSTRRRYVTGGVLDADRLAADILQTPHVKLWSLPVELVQRRVRALETPSFAGVVEASFLAYADHHGKRRWGDKTPIYVLWIPLLANLFPSARFIQLIRDGRDVALSYLSVPWGPRTIWQAAWKWDRDVRSGRRAGRALGVGRYLELRYEDLVRDPRGTLESASAFIRVEFSEDMLRFHEDGRERLFAPSDGIPFHAGSARPPTAGVRDWRSQMPVASVRAFEAVAGELLGELGYALGAFDAGRYPRLEASVMARAFDLRTAGSRFRKGVERAVLRRPVAGIEDTDPGGTRWQT